jgi:hypothetical protein
MYRGGGNTYMVLKKPKANRKIGRRKSRCKNNIKKGPTKIVFGAWTGLT